jgi:myo-inositol-1(or 4)-monophosphatase
MITEAGGLVGNFTGDADYLYQREVVAGNPKIYAQLVQLLSPYTRMIASGPAAVAEAQPSRAGAQDALTPEAALIATEAEPEGEGEAVTPRKKAPVRIRKSDVLEPDKAR